MTLFNKTLCTLILVMSVHFAFSQEFVKSDKLPVDEQIKIGKLENGLTYYIRKAQNPANRAEFFIIHNVGSLQEESNQRGLAHFLEHMAFNGTKHYPKKKMLEYFASIGVKFGANINAYTSMDRTVYNLSSVPVVRPTVVDSALLVLHDWSYYISCEPKEIEAERGVIREEWRRGDDARTRMMKAIFKIQQTGSRFAERDVIGLPEIINTFKPQTLVDYYHKWYRPDLQAVVVVGDIDVNDIENRIKKMFSSIPKAKNPAKRESYSVPDNAEPIIGYITDPESKGYSTRIVIKYPFVSTPEKQTKQLIYDDVMQYLVSEMIKNRCDRLPADSMVKAAIPATGAISYAMRTFTITALPIGNRMVDAAKVVVTEIERVAKHGFSKEELTIAIPAVKKQIESNYRRAKDQKNEDYVNRIVEHFTRNEPLISPEERYKLQTECLKSITTEQVNEFTPKMIRADNRLLIFACPQKDSINLPTKEECLKFMKEIKDSDLPKYEPIKNKTLQFEKNLTPIAVKSEVISKDTTYTWQLANGAKVIFKKSGEQGDNIKLYAIKKGGYSATDEKDLKLTRFMERFTSQFIIGGLKKQDMTKWCAANNVSLKPSIDYRYDEFSGTFTKKSAENLFKLLNLYMSEYSIDEKDIAYSKTQTLKELAMPTGSHEIYKDTCQKLEYSYYPFSGKITPSEVELASITNISKLYDAHFCTPSQFTYILSGPAEPSEIKALCEKYIATLSDKSAPTSQFKDREPVVRKGEVSLFYKGKNLKSSKANFYRSYSGKVEYTTENYVKARFLVYILRERYMKSIREEKGGTYHVGVGIGTIQYPQPLFRISIDFDTDPKLVQELAEIVQKEIEKVTTEGVSDKEVKEVMLYLKKGAEEKKSIKRDWAADLKNSIKGNVDLTIGEENYFDKITSKELKKFAQQLFSQKNRMTFIFAPEN